MLRLAERPKVLTKLYLKSYHRWDPEKDQQNILAYFTCQLEATFETYGLPLSPSLSSAPLSYVVPFAPFS